MRSILVWLFIVDLIFVKPCMALITILGIYETRNHQTFLFFHHYLWSPNSNIM